jgi:hypothetical protein
MSHSLEYMSFYSGHLEKSLMKANDVVDQLETR